MKFQMMLVGAVVLAGIELAGTVLQAQGPKFKESISVQGVTRFGHSELALTFSGPVALPGMSLAPGTYIFRRPAANAVQVASVNGEPYQMFLTIPTERATASDGYSIVLGPPAAPDSPRRIVAMFGPGERTGQAFVYSTH